MAHGSVNTAACKQRFSLGCVFTPMALCADNCPDGHVWDASANFKMGLSAAAGSSLEVVFSKPYAGDPFCRVSFENVWLHHQQDSHASGLTIRIADSNGADKPWSDVQTWMMVMCHGSTPEDACVVPPGACDCSGTRPDECGVCGGSGPPEGGTCWFGPKMRTGAIVPRANADLDRAYQTSGLSVPSIIKRWPALFVLGHISPIFARFFATFSLFSPS